jgi:hypothetical protein
VESILEISNIFLEAEVKTFAEVKATLEAEIKAC